MFEFLPHPDIKPTNLADQTKQTNEYLFRLKESLEFMLTTIDVENLSPEFRARLEAIGVDINTNGISEDMIAQMASNAITIEDVLDSYLMDERFKEELKDVLTQEDIDELSALLKAHTDSKSNPHGVTKAQVGLGNVNNTSDADKPVSTAQQEAIDGVSASVTAHTGNKSNPHGVTKAQLGLGNVNNTSDASKPVSTAQQSAIDSAYANATAYTDQKVADLINGAPSTLDTLKEIADAMAGNADVVEALEESIGTKANQSELDSHTGNTTVHVTASEKSSWNKAYLENHTHSNKSVLDGITSALVTAWNSAVTHISDTVKHITATERSNWNSAYNTMHTHSNKSVLDGTTASFTTAEKTKLSGIASGANAYTHPTYNAYSGFPKDTVTTSFGYPLTISVVDTDETGHVTAMNQRTVVMPNDEATQTSRGLMSADDKKRLDNLIAIQHNTATTGSTGNIATGLYSAHYKIITTVVNGYIAIPFVSNGSWYIKVLNINTISAVANTSVTYTIEYITERTA